MYGKKHCNRSSVGLNLLEHSQCITRLHTLRSKRVLSSLSSNTDNSFFRHKTLCPQVYHFCSKRKPRSHQQNQTCFLVHCKALRHVLSEQWTDWLTKPFLWDSSAEGIQNATVGIVEILNAYLMKQKREKSEYLITAKDKKESFTQF